MRASVGQGLVGELPNAFVWVELRCVAWEADEMKARGAADESLDQRAVLGRAAILACPRRTRSMPRTPGRPSGQLVRHGPLLAPHTGPYVRPPPHPPHPPHPRSLSTPPSYPPPRP